MSSELDTRPRFASNGVNESTLHAHRFLLRAGFSIANVFAWIFIFEYFYILSGNVARAFAGVVILYALAQIITIVATPISAAHLRRGTKHSIIWGAIAAAGAFVLLGTILSGYFFVDGGSTSFLWGIAGFAVLIGAYRALYWIPYKLTRAATKPYLRMGSYFEMLIALMPLFAGLTIASVPFAAAQLLFGTAALIVLSAIPVLFFEDARERFSWSYVYTFKQLLKRKNYGLVLRALLDGLQGAALFLVWPLAVFLIVEWSYFTLGIVFSMTLLIILLLRGAYGWILGSVGLRDSTSVHVVVSVSAWIARFAAGTPFGVIVADSYSYVTEPERDTRADPFSFEQASDRGAFLDEYTALKEIALALGRIKLCVVVFLLTFIFALPVVLAIALGVAAAASGISVLVARRGSTPTY